MPHVIYKKSARYRMVSGAYSFILPLAHFLKDVSEPNIYTICYTYSIDICHYN